MWTIVSLFTLIWCHRLLIARVFCSLGSFERWLLRLLLVKCIIGWLPTFLYLLRLFVLKYNNWLLDENNKLIVVVFWVNVIVWDLLGVLIYIGTHPLVSALNLSCFNITVIIWTYKRLFGSLLLLDLKHVSLVDVSIDFDNFFLQLWDWGWFFALFCKIVLAYDLFEIYGVFNGWIYSFAKSCKVWWLCTNETCSLWF